LCDFDISSGIKRAGTHEDEPQAKKNKLGTTTCVN